MDPADLLNAILTEIEARMCALFDADPSQVFEYRVTGEASGTALYLTAAVTDMKPMTACAEQATVETMLGFHVPRHATKGDRVYRLELQSQLRDRLVFGTNHPDAIPNAGLWKTTSMGMTFGDDPDEGYLMGGITIEFATALRRKGA